MHSERSSEQLDNDMQLLSAALAFTFSRPVTAYLTRAQIVVNHGCGFTYMHSRADPSIGRFLDGNLIRTSLIMWLRREGKFWVLLTRNDSFYVIVSFDPYGGFNSLVDHLCIKAWIRRIAPITRQ